MLDGSGVKAMPGLIPTPNYVSLKKYKKILVAKWGTPNNIFRKYHDLNLELSNLNNTQRKRILEKFSQFKLT